MQRLTPKRGFTLIELLVSVALFSVVAVIVAAAYLNLISLDRRTRATNDLVNNMSYVLDSMEREVRTGTNYSCSGGDGYCDGTTGFSFKDQNGCAVTYALANSGPNSGQIVETSAGDGCTGSVGVPLNDPRIQITQLRFVVSGVGTNDNVEPQVLIVMTGSLTADPKQAPITFSIETSATQRGIDL